MSRNILNKFKIEKVEQIMTEIELYELTTNIKRIISHIHPDFILTLELSDINSNSIYSAVFTNRYSNNEADNISITLYKHNNATILEVSCQKVDILDKPVSYYSEYKIMELGNIIDIDRVENCIKSAYTTVISQYNQYYREYKNSGKTI